MKVTYTPKTNKINQLRHRNENFICKFDTDYEKNHHNEIRDLNNEIERRNIENWHL